MYTKIENRFVFQIFSVRDEYNITSSFTHNTISVNESLKFTVLLYMLMTTESARGPG